MIRIYILYDMGENNVLVIHIYGALSIFLLFCYSKTQNIND